MIAFILGISIILIALVVPMDIFGIYSMFTVHMIQRLLFSLAVPPLLLLSIPLARANFDAAYGLWQARVGDIAAMWLTMGVVAVFVFFVFGFLVFRAVRGWG